MNSPETCKNKRKKTDIAIQINLPFSWTHRTASRAKEHVFPIPGSAAKKNPASDQLEIEFTFTFSEHVIKANSIRLLDVDRTFSLKVV